MKKGLIFTIMLVTVLALGYSQTTLSGTYRYSTNAYVTFTGNAFKGLWNATTPMSGTYSVSGARLTLNITDGPKARNTWVWTITDANTLKDQDGDTWKKEGAGGTAQARTSPAVEWNVNSMASWIEAVGGVRSGGNNKAHVITVTGDISVPTSNGNTFGSVTGITVTIQGDGSITPSSNGNLIFIGASQTVVLKGDITLRGRNDNNNDNVVVIVGTFRMEDNSTVMGNNGRGVYVGGTFTMSGGTISGNTGSGVYVYDGGTFTMSGGTISGNTGSGVNVGSTFTMSGGTISGNTGSGVNVGVRSTFTMSAGTISGNTSSDGGGVYVNIGGTFNMKGGTISGNTAWDNGGGVRVMHGVEFTMSGGAISGNTARGNGGGVYGDSDSFTKTGGTISGNDATEADRNTAKQGHAVYSNNPWNNNWRNATAGPRMNTDTYGFWMNEVEVFEFPSSFIGTWKRDNFNNTLTFSANFFTDSAQSGFIINLVRISGNSYTCAGASNGREITLTFRLVNGNIEISGDSGDGETNWNGTWRKQR